MEKSNPLVLHKNISPDLQNIQVSIIQDKKEQSQSSTGICRHSGTKQNMFPCLQF